MVKNILFKIFQIETLLQRSRTQGYQQAILEQAEKEKEQKLYKMTLNFPIGEKVICTFNSGPMVVAKVIGYEDYGHSVMLKLKDLEDGREFVTGGVIIPYDENRYQALVKLPWWEQWNVTTAWGASLTAQEALNISEGRPAWDNGTN